MSESYTLSVEKVMPQPPEKIWELITNPNLFDGLGIPGAFLPHETDKPGKGTELRFRSISAGPGAPHKGTLFICDWEPHVCFSFGGSPSEWLYKYELSPMKEGSNVKFTRAFDPITIMDRISDMDLTGKKNQETMKVLTQNTIDKLSAACKNLKAGQAHGI